MLGCTPNNPFQRLVQSEHDFLEFHLNRGEVKDLLDYIHDVDSFLERGLPVEVSWVKGTNPHKAFKLEFASKVPFSAPFSKSALWGNGLYFLEGEWWEEY